MASSHMSEHTLLKRKRLESKCQLEENLEREKIAKKKSDDQNDEKKVKPNNEMDDLSRV